MPAGMAPSTYRVSGFRRGTLRSQLVSFFERCKMAKHRGGLGFNAIRLHDDFGQSSSSVKLVSSSLVLCDAAG